LFSPESLILLMRVNHISIVGLFYWFVQLFYDVCRRYFRDDKIAGLIRLLMIEWLLPMTSIDCYQRYRPGLKTSVL